MPVKIKIPYEPPMIIDLSSGVAHAVPTVCNQGATPQQNQCTAGGSPGQACLSGSMAYGGNCQNGVIASTACTQGRSPASKDCKMGFSAASTCSIGTTAGK